MSRFDEHLFGRIAVLGGYVSREQLDACLQVQRQRYPQPYIGQVLLDEGYLNEEQIRNILAIRRQKLRKFNLTRVNAADRDRDFAKQALREKLLNLDQLEDAVLEQQLLRALNLHFTLGEVFLSRRDMEKADILRILTIQGRRMLCCPVCDCHYRAPEYRQEERYECRKCGSVLAPSRFLDDQLADGILEPNLQTEKAGTSGAGD